MGSLGPAFIGLLGVIIGSFLAFFMKLLEQRRQRREEELSAVRLVSLELLANAEALELILLLRHASAPEDAQDIDYWAGEAGSPVLEDSAWREYRRALSCSLGDAWSDVAEAYLGLRQAERWLKTRVPQTPQSLQNLLKKVRMAGLLLGWAGRSGHRLRLLRKRGARDEQHLKDKGRDSGLPPTTMSNGATGSQS